MYYKYSKNIVLTCEEVSFKLGKVLDTSNTLYTERNISTKAVFFYWIPSKHKILFNMYFKENMYIHIHQGSFLDQKRQGARPYVKGTPGSERVPLKACYT